MYLGNRVHWEINRTTEQDEMETYEITMVKRTDFYGGDQSAIDASPVLIIEADGKNAACRMAGEAFKDVSNSVYITCGVRKIPSKKKVAALIEAGATDLRGPRVATTAMRKSLGALVGF